MIEVLNVAVWYMRHYSADFELCATEEEAARFAVVLRDEGMGALLGVQFSDGHLIPYRSWSFLDEVEERMCAEQAARAAQQAPARPTRTIRDPFQGEPVEVEEAPSWLGRN